jgi:5-methyltetrahydropteroyltriglutamate--homocysteine methyltransferase
MYREPLLTTVVGSYPQARWLVDQNALEGRLVPRVRAPQLWRVPPELLEQAQDDATLLAIRDMERAGIDIISDGEIRRESYSNRFATALEGVDSERPGSTIGRTGEPNPVPRITGPIRRSRPVQVRDVQFLRSNTSRRIKATIPGPFTMSQQAQNEHYPNDRALAMDYAQAVNQEVKELFDAGADIVQLDEPWLQARVERAREFGIEAINRALDGVDGPTALHLCFGYAVAVREKPSAYSFLSELEDTPVQMVSIEAAQPKLDLSVLAQMSSKTVILGVLDLGDMNVEAPGTVAQRIRAALEYLAPERLMLAPDCGMKYLPREVARGKLRAMVLGAAIVKAELGL